MLCTFVHVWDSVCVWRNEEDSSTPNPTGSTWHWDYDFLRLFVHVLEISWANAGAIGSRIAPISVLLQSCSPFLSHVASRLIPARTFLKSSLVSIASSLAKFAHVVLFQAEHCTMVEEQSAAFAAQVLEFRLRAQRLAIVLPFPYRHAGVE